MRIWVVPLSEHAGKKLGSLGLGRSRSLVSRAEFTGAPNEHVVQNHLT